jgi:hypothetical protein
MFSHTATPHARDVFFSVRSGAVVGDSVAVIR